jgi:hypothetical protein
MTAANWLGSDLLWNFAYLCGLKEIDEISWLQNSMGPGIKTRVRCEKSRAPKMTAVSPVDRQHVKKPVPVPIPLQSCPI